MPEHTDPLDMLWSLWAELGVPGVLRAHEDVAVDPEPLVLYTPFLAARDARLREMATSWCVRHHGLLGSVRMKGLHRSAPEPVAAAFAEFAATLDTVTSTRWPAADQAPAALQAEALRPMGVPLERRSLVWLRARAAMGPGARADLLCAMLAEPDERRAADLDPVGYSRRAVDDVLSTWTSSGMVETIRVSGVRSYSLRRRNAWLAVLDAQQLRWMDVRTVMEFLVARVQLETVRDAKTIVRQVEAGRVRERLAALPARRRRGLPQVDGRPDAWERVCTFVRRSLQEQDSHGG